MSGHTGKAQLSTLRVVYRSYRFRKQLSRSFTIKMFRRTLVIQQCRRKQKIKHLSREIALERGTHLGCFSH